MSMASGIAQCSTCQKKTSAFMCGGCHKYFCLTDLNGHTQDLAKELDRIETDSGEFRQQLNDKGDDPEKRSFIEQIDRWENESIDKIKQTAQLCREQIIERRNQLNYQIEQQLNKHIQTLKEARAQKGINEIDIERLNNNLKQLKHQLDQTMNVQIESKSSTFIQQIFVNTIDRKEPDCIVRISMDTSWKPEATTVAAGNESGYGLHQLSNPQGLYVYNDQTVYIADKDNHRIIAWKQGATSGQVVAGLKGKGRYTDQFNDPRYVFINKEIDSIIVSDTYNARIMKWPRQNGFDGQVIISNVNCSGLVMDNQGFLYVTDIKKHEVRRYRLEENTGTVVAGGNGNGSALNQLSYPTYVIVDKDCSVYVSDEYNHRVMKWTEGATEGIVVAGGHRYGYGLTQLYNPQGIAVDQWGTVYVADMNNHRVMRWPRGASQGSIIAGGNNKGGDSNQLSFLKVYHSINKAISMLLTMEILEYKNFLFFQIDFFF